MKLLVNIRGAEIKCTHKFLLRMWKWYPQRLSYSGHIFPTASVLGDKTLDF